jgi:branched-chain amino acid transport system ATP-binding protein
MTEPALEISELRKTFGGVLANDGINLVLSQGEIHGLVGPNGSGKTTLIAQIMGEMTPNSGEIRVFGKTVTALPVHARSHLGVARSWQTPSLFPLFSAADNVTFGLRSAQGLSSGVWRPGATKTLYDEARKLLNTVGLGSEEHTAARDLSHGDQRKLDVAIALSTSPSLILLDEPLAGLGADESSEMMALIRGLRDKGPKSQKRTIVLVEHDMDAVFALSDRISVLVEGKILATETPETIRDHDGVRAAYLGDG